MTKPSHHFLACVQVVAFQDETKQKTSTVLVNLMITNEEPFMTAAMLELLHRNAAQQMADRFSIPAERLAAIAITGISHLGYMTAEQFQGITEENAGLPVDGGAGDSAEPQESSQDVEQALN